MADPSVLPSELGAIATVCSFVVSVGLTVGAWIHLKGRQSKSSEIAEADAKEAHKKADDAVKALAAVKAEAETAGQHAKDAGKKAEENTAALAAFKTHAAENFVLRPQLDQMESRILGRMDKQDDRTASEVGSIRSLIEQFMFGRKDHAG